MIKKRNNFPLTNIVVVVFLIIHVARNRWVGDDCELRYACRFGVCVWVCESRYEAGGDVSANKTSK